MAVTRSDPRVALVVGVLLAVAGCSSGATTPPVSSSATASTSAPAATDGIASAADVGRVMRAGAGSLQSAQIEVDGGGTTSADLSGDGAATFDGGRLTALEVSGPAEAGDGELRIRIVGGTAYARTYDLDGNPTAPWQRVTTSNPAAADVRVSVAALAAAIDPGPLADALGAASTFREVGTVGYGIRYSLADVPAGTALAAALGADVRPTEAYVDLDPAGRPRAAYVRMTVDGVAYGVRSTWSDFDAPVTIDTPPAGEIAD